MGLGFGRPDGGTAHKVRPIAAQLLPLISQRFSACGQNPEDCARANVVGQVLGSREDYELGEAITD